MANFIPKMGTHNNLPAISTGSFIITTDNKEIYLDTVNGRELISNGQQEIEYIIGTQTTATNAWTGITKDTALYAGKVIAYKLPYDGTNSAATLSLKLNNGSGLFTTPTIIYRQGTGTITKHYPANSIIFLTYDGTNWRTDGDYNTQNTFYGVCDTIATTTAKTIDNVPGFTLSTGVTINVKFTNLNSASNPTLEVNGTGAKALKQYGTTAIGTTSATTGWFPGAIVQFTYDGTNWVRNQGYNSNTTYSALTTSEAWAGTATADRSITAANLKAILANLDGSGLTLTHNTTSGIVLGHANSITANTSFPTGTSVSANGGSFTVRDLKYDAQGHITGYQDREITLSQNIYTLTTATSSLLGGIKIGYTTTGNNYAVQLNDGKAYVNVPWENTTYTFDGTYNASSNKAATVATVTSAINALNVTAITSGAANTITSISETNGKISATYSAISIAPSQINAAIPNDKLVTSGISIAGTQVALDGSITADTLRENLNLSQTLRFIGVTSAGITDGNNTIPTDLGITNYEPLVGDVVIDSSTQYEYVWVKGTGFLTGRWEKLGGDSSYKIVQDAVNAATTASTTATTTFVSAISQNSNGVISYTTKPVATATTATNGIMTSAMVTKLNGIATGATANTAATAAPPAIGTATTGTSTNYARQDHTHALSTAYLPLAGGTMTGPLTLKGHNGTLNYDYGTTLPASPTIGQIFFQIQDTPIYEIPDGGSSGQALIKASNNDRDVMWGTVGGGGMLKPDTSATYYVAGSTSTVQNTNPAVFNTNVYVSNNVLFGAAWNDYAEYRQTNEQIEPGRVIVENGDGTLSLSTERLQRGCEIVSDTFGFAIGKTDKSQTPIAVSGRVLAFIDIPIDNIKHYIGWPVCSGPDGTVSIMTEEEEEKYPSRIIGTISEIPKYDTWSNGKVKVNNRIWIRVR